VNASGEAAGDGEAVVDGEAASDGDDTVTLTDAVIRRQRRMIAPTVLKKERRRRGPGCHSANAMLICSSVTFPLSRP
jgi:hypothetical protein